MLCLRTIKCTARNLDVWIPDEDSPQRARRVDPASAVLTVITLHAPPPCIILSGLDGSARLSELRIDTIYQKHRREAQNKFGAASPRAGIISHSRRADEMHSSQSFRSCVAARRLAEPYAARQAEKRAQISGHTTALSRSMTLKVSIGQVSRRRGVHHHRHRERTFKQAKTRD